MERPSPSFFYTQPMFRADSPDFAKAKGQIDWTLQTPGIRLRLALDYYRFEAFTTEHDRDARCGATAHEDVRYAPATITDRTATCTPTAAGCSPAAAGSDGRTTIATSACIRTA